MKAAMAVSAMTPTTTTKTMLKAAERGWDGGAGWDGGLRVSVQ
jgi:hypothetical protein